MKLGIVVVVLVGVALLRSSGTNGQGIFGPNWLSGLTNSLGDLNRNIQANVQQLNHRIAETVNREVAEARRLAEDSNGNIDTGRWQSFDGGVVSGSGNNIIVTNANGISRTVLSGRTPNGTAYVRDIAESTKDGVLRHVEKIFHPETNKTQTIAWTLDLNVPGSKLVPIVDDKV